MRVALLDTSLQIDRQKMGARWHAIEELLSEYDHTVATGISLLEFKAVLIQTLITIHNELRRKGALFTRVRDRLIESVHYQSRLRAHIFNNVIGVYASSRSISVEDDERYAKKARLQIENIIPEVYSWFKHESAGTYLNATRINCTRADDEPRKEGRAFDANLPKCKVGKNRFCQIERFVREHGAEMRAGLETVPDATDADRERHSQLLKARSLFRRIEQDKDFRCSVEDCRGAGDCLIALEAKGIANEALSTNLKEWELLCPWVGLVFRPVVYPDDYS